MSDPRRVTLYNLLAVWTFLPDDWTCAQAMTLLDALGQAALEAGEDAAQWTREWWARFRLRPLTREQEVDDGETVAVDEPLEEAQAVGPYIQRQHQERPRSFVSRRLPRTHATRQAAK